MAASKNEHYGARPWLNALREAKEQQERTAELSIHGQLFRQQAEFLGYVLRLVVPRVMLNQQQRETLEAYFEELVADDTWQKSRLKHALVVATYINASGADAI